MAPEVESYLLDLPELFLLMFFMPPVWDKEESSGTLVQCVPRKAMAAPGPPSYTSLGDFLISHLLLLTLRGDDYIKTFWTHQPLNNDTQTYFFVL